jgi:hypothetical protein
MPTMLYSLAAKAERAECRVLTAECFPGYFFKVTNPTTSPPEASTAWA